MLVIGLMFPCTEYNVNAFIPGLGGASGIGLPRMLQGGSLKQQRAETFMTHTGAIRGSFVSFTFKQE